jgi:hypothetical protein
MTRDVGPIVLGTTYVWEKDAARTSAETLWAAVARNGRVESGRRWRRWRGWKDPDTRLKTVFGISHGRGGRPAAPAKWRHAGTNSTLLNFKSY